MVQNEDPLRNFSRAIGRRRGRLSEWVSIAALMIFTLIVVIAWGSAALWLASLVLHWIW